MLNNTCEYNLIINYMVKKLAAGIVSPALTKKKQQQFFVL